MHRLLITIVALIGLAAIAQTTGRIAFEVASVKPAKDCADNMSPVRAEQGSLQLSCVTVAGLIQTAYVWYADGSPGSQRSAPLEGAPNWVQSDYFDIQAKAAGDVTPGQMRGPMTQALLEDRFKLKLRRESRDVSAYALTPARRGSKLTPFKEGSRTPGGSAAKSAASSGPRCPAGITVTGTPGIMRVEARGMSFRELAGFLQMSLDRPVVDRTGIEGRFDYVFEFAPDETTPRVRRPQDAAAVTGPRLSDALEEQFGIKLESTKAPSLFLFVENIERPSEN